MAVATYLSQGAALVVKNTTLLLRARVIACVLVLLPPLFVVSIGLIDMSLNTPPAIVESTTPFLTLTDAEPLECHVFGSSRSEYGLGVPIPEAWCAPMLYSPSSNTQVRSVVQTLAERRGWTTAELSGGNVESSEMPAACAARACMLGFATSKDLALWLASNLGRAATAIAFKTPDGNGSLVDLSGSSLPDRVTVEIWYNESALAFYASNGFDKLAGGLNPAQLQLAAQHAVEEAILATKVSPDARSSVSLRRYPIVVRKDPVDGVRVYGGLFFYIPLMLPMMLTLNLMVSEKELGMLGVMRQLGLRESLWWGSFVLQAAAVLLLSACSMHAVGTLMDITFFSMADFGVVLPTFWLFGMASVGGGCVLAALITRTRVSNLATFVVLVFGLIVSVITGQLEFIVSLLVDPTIMPGGRVIGGFLQFVYPPLAFAKARLDVAVVTKRVPQVDASTKLTSYVPGNRYTLFNITAGNYTGTQSSLAQTADTPLSLRTYVLPPTGEALGLMVRLCSRLAALTACRLPRSAASAPATLLAARIARATRQKQTVRRATCDAALLNEACPPARGPRSPTRGPSIFAIRRPFACSSPCCSLPTSRRRGRAVTAAASHGTSHCYRATGCPRQMCTATQRCSAAFRSSPLRATLQRSTSTSLPRRGACSKGARLQTARSCCST
jgi:hypothetical protein